MPTGATKTTNVQIHQMRTAQQTTREAERRSSVQIRIGISSQGLGSSLDQISVSLDQNCGADGWTVTPRGVAFGKTARGKASSMMQ